MIKKKEEFDILRKYLWDYFELHANQRISLFKFYLGITSLFYAGTGVLVWHLKDPGALPEIVGISSCALFSLSTVIFWLLDYRIRALIHYSEEALRKTEQDCIIEKTNQIRIFCKEKESFPCIFFRHTGLFWTFFALNILACILIAIGLFFHQCCFR